MPETTNIAEINGYHADVSGEQEAQLNLDYFWHQVTDDETLARLSQWDKRWMIDATLWVGLEPLKIRLNPPKVQDIELSQFETWRPKSKNEAYAATHRGGPRQSIRAIQSLWQDAFEDERVMARGSRAGRSDVELIRGSEAVLYTMAECLVARESFINGEWPKKNSDEYKVRQKYYRGLMLAAAQSAGDEPFIKLYEQISSEVAARLEYWSREFNIPIRLTGKIVTREIVKKAEEPTLFKTESQPEHGSPFRMPDSVQEELSRWLAEYAVEYDRLDHMGIPQWKKQQILEEKFPRFKSAREVEEAAKQEDREARARAAAEGGTHLTGPRGKKHYFDNDNARADSDRYPL